MWTETSWLYRVFSSLSVLLMTLDFNFNFIEGNASADVDHHLEMGKRLLAAGQLTEALSHYHSAIEGDPENYMTYFKRATVLLALGRSKTALKDLTKVVELRHDFIRARVQRANIYLKQGNLDEAVEDYEYVIQNSPDDNESLEKKELVEQLRMDVASAQEYFDEHRYQETIDLLQRPLEHSPWSVSLREMRAECFQHTGQYFKAIQDLKPTTKLVNDNTEAYLKVSHLYYALGESEESLKEIRECLKLDQDHKACHKHYKKVKKLVKLFTDAQKYMDREQFSDAIFKLNAALKHEKENIRFIANAKEKLCTSQYKLGDSKEAIKACTEAIELSPQSAHVYCDRAEAYLLEDNFDEALKDFQEAKTINNDHQRAKEGIDRVNKLIKQSKKRDYYKILGVKRNAAKPEILKKFRKLAAKWHPDKFPEDEEKKKAEKKFIDIAAAKEVLTDPEKRQKYDMGEDPLDPESQQGQGFNPFQQGFGGFGDGFGDFKFHFN
ncbi:dnaJ homolog subfamily C member 3-like [Clytia hemisphaerica]|uniref:J domain-containing protein n=1 Tax=Clytia hemisphaerica TaxID=252671 RepID=A0A7M5U2B6_9CNID